MNYSGLATNKRSILDIRLAGRLVSHSVLILATKYSSKKVRGYNLVAPRTTRLTKPHLHTIYRGLGVPPILGFNPYLTVKHLRVITARVTTRLNISLPRLPLILSTTR